MLFSSVFVRSPYSWLTIGLYALCVAKVRVFCDISKFFKIFFIVNHSTYILFIFLLAIFCIANFAIYIANSAIYIANFAMYIPNFERKNL